ncbi:MAG TPA: hypothetical protein VGB84_08285 [Arachidicoccus sp.]
MMKTKIKYIYLFIGIFFIAGLFIMSCNKNKPYDVTIPPTMAEFTADNSIETFGINNIPSPTYKVPLGLTSKSNKDVSITLSISSPTGAKNGVQYTLKDSIITFKAGTVVDSLEISSDFSQYEGDRVDTLVLTIVSANGATVFDEANKLTLVLRKSCPVIIDDFLGSVVIDDPNFWGDVDPGIVTKVNDNTLNITGLFGESSYNFNVVINQDGSASVSKQVVGPTLPTTSYTNPTIQGNGKYDACDQILSLTLTYTVDQGSFGASPLTIHRK